jgi:predicted MFS family arabinose efflux permease
MPPETSPRRIRAALLALAGATFVFVTSELQPVALLPEMSRGLGVAPGMVGILLTAYAGVAGAAAIPVTALTARMSRRRLVLVSVLMLVVSQAGAAVAPTYAALLVARLIAALAHGVFWSIVARVAASLLGPQRSGRATAVVFGGNSLALVLGTPLVTALGAAIGWRLTVAGLGAVAALVAGALAVTLPEIPAQPSPSRTVAEALRNRSVLAVCGVTVLIVIGHFTAFTYFVPLAQRHTGLSGGALSIVFLLYGAAGVIGLTLVGAVTDRHPGAAMLACGGAMTLAMLGLSALPDSLPVPAIVAILLWGAAFTALPVCLQAAVLRVAPRVPDTASSVYVVAFQIGIGTGSLLGAVLVDGGSLGVLTPLALITSAAATGLVAVSRSAFPRAGRAPAAAGGRSATPQPGAR